MVVPTGLRLVDTRIALNVTDSLLFMLFVVFPRKVESWRLEFKADWQISGTEGRIYVVAWILMLLLGGFPGHWRCVGQFNYCNSQHVVYNSNRKTEWIRMVSKVSSEFLQDCCSCSPSLPPSLALSLWPSLSLALSLSLYLSPSRSIFFFINLTMRTALTQKHITTHLFKDRYLTVH